MATFLNAKVDEDGKFSKKKINVVLSGFIRSKGLGAQSLDKILTDKDILPFKTTN